MPCEIKYYNGSLKELQSLIRDGFSFNQDNPATDALRLCKLFGAYRCMSEIKDMVPIIHGPIGCACNNRHFVGLATKAHGFPVDLVITCTDLDETDAVFGGEEKLKKAIVEVDRKYQPKIITVFNSCPTGIIGDDIDGIVDSIQTEIKAKVFAVHSEGYGHFNLYAGYKAAYEALVKNLVKTPLQRKKNSINIVGDKNDYRAGNGMNDIRSLFKTLDKLDIELNAVLPGGATIEDFENCALVELNVMKCDSMAVDFCMIMKDRFGIDYTKATIPIGIKASERWFLELAEKLSIEKKAKKIIDSELQEIKPFVENAKSVLAGKRVAVTGNYARAIAFLEFAMELGMKPAYLGLYGFAFAGEAMVNRLCNKIDEDFELVIGISMHEHKEMIRRLKPDMFLGDFREKACPMNSGIPSGDVPLGMQPQLGFEGVKTLASSMLKWWNSPLINSYGKKFGNDRAMCNSYFFNKCLAEGQIKTGK